jgi:hypothetical protein
VTAPTGGLAAMLGGLAAYVVPDVSAQTISPNDLHEFLE